MPRAKTTKFYRTFSKGLITEAGYLTYPEDSSSDELNTILSRKGNRSRRLGADYENGFAMNNLPATEDVATMEFVWESVNQDPNVSFMCLQIGTVVHFFKLNNAALSSQKTSFTINLTNYKIPTATIEQFTSEYCDMTAGSGFLFIAQRLMDPISVQYMPATDSLVVVPIVIQIRDFEGVYDGLANDDEPSTLTPAHHYNLLNQGWITPGTRAVDISSPDYAGGGVDGGGVAGGAGVPYYDPYVGEVTYSGDRGYTPGTDIP